MANAAKRKYCDTVYLDPKALDLKRGVWADDTPVYKFSKKNTGGKMNEVVFIGEAAVSTKRLDIPLIEDITQVPEMLVRHNLKGNLNGQTWETMDREYKDIIEKHNLGAEFLPTGCEIEGINTGLSAEKCQERIRRDEAEETKVEKGGINLAWKLHHQIQVNGGMCGAFGVCLDSHILELNQSLIEYEALEPDQWRCIVCDLEQILTTSGGDKNNPFPVAMSRHGICKISDIFKALSTNGVTPAPVSYTHLTLPTKWTV